MEARKKRALLARIEGQIAAMDRDDSDAARRWQRIDWALAALAELPLSAREKESMSRLRHHVDRMQQDLREGWAADLQAHRRTLVRTDCVLWQMQLRRRREIPDSEAA